MYEEAIRIIRRYIDTCIEDDVQDEKGTYPRLAIANGHIRWAADEVLALMLCESEKPPPYVTGVPAKEVEEIIEEYAATMDHYGLISKSPDARGMFYLAANTAYNILSFYKVERRNCR